MNGSSWLLAALTIIAALSALTFGAAPAVAESDHDARSAQLARGAEVYAFSCTTCHGATGRGFAEARAAFPPDHYECNRCHMPLNPPAMTPLQIEQTQSVFSLGHAPPLADAHALARFGTAQALFAYVRTTMPRWHPGRLDDDAYLDVTAFVLDLAGLLPEGTTLEPDALADVRLEVGE
jgi:mono/diheme cytochrome c family protein